MATAMSDIRSPPGIPFLGHIRCLDANFPLGSLISLAEEYGEIFRLEMPGRTILVLSTRELVNDACDEKRFRKSIGAALKEVRIGVHDGLFTAMAGEENWGIAHRTLMPAFGPFSIRGMFDEMHDIASQLTMKWARFGPDTPIMVSDDFTRLTLDTLALCSMGYRFNSFYSEEMHPFIAAMGDFLTEAGVRGRRFPLPAYFYRASEQKFEQDIEVLRSTARGVLDARKESPSDRKDLLAAMLNGRDTKTGKKMTDENIMDNLITFLIAGHETTSGLLSFTFYQLIRHPEAYQKAQREVDEVIGKGSITVDHLSKLPYINGLLRESLRINATIPAFVVEPIEDTILAGKYHVKEGTAIVNLLAKAHLDPAVYGDDVNEFKPERMMDKPFNKLMQDFPNAWKPFGNGMRGCIGRPFAWQEALLVVAMLLQNFNFVADDPNYQLAIKQTLTIKPKGFQMRATLRDGLTATSLQHRLSGSSDSEKHAEAAAANAANDTAASGVPMTVLYGSNSGTCESLAQRVATDAAAHGFHVSRIDSLDSAKGKLPKNQPVVIVTASYEGEPPDNAAGFVSWIQDCTDQDALKDVSYAVFGCGHKDWVQTYHRIPRLVDERLEQLGARRIGDLGLADVSRGDVFTDFETWEDQVLWPSASGKFEISAQDKAKAQAKSRISVAVSTPRVSMLRQEVKEAVVVEAESLTKDGEKRHIEIKLPEGMSYSVGDYLAVLPMNPWETVHRVTRRFGLGRDAHLDIANQGSPTHLPTKSSILATEVLESYVELCQTATKRNIGSLANYAASSETKSELQRLASDAYSGEITDKRVSVLAILERFPDIELPIGEFLSMMPPMRVRQYSISSSPLWKPDHVTLTFSILNELALSGQGAHIGVATSYLASLLESDSLHVSVRPSHPAFSLPSDPEKTPIICIAGGSGIAPFRGFIQDRAAMIAKGRSLAPATLFFGCHSPDDDLYRAQLDEWERQGAVEVHRAYSRVGPGQHVDDVMWEQRERIIDLWSQEAKVFVCGSRGLAESAKEALIRIRVEVDGKDADEDKIREWFEGLRNIRYVMDIFD